MNVQKLHYLLLISFSISILTLVNDCIGMFLYARLVCDSIGMLGDIESIKDAVNDLPDGLNEASVPPTSLQVASTNTHTATTESFLGSQKAWKYANAMMLSRF